MDSEKTRTYLINKQEFEELYQSNNEYNIYNNNMDKFLGIWRYMDFSKFVNLLDSSSLFFSKTSSFRDPYEGSYSEVDIKRIIGHPGSFVPDNKSVYDEKRQQLMKKSELLLGLVGVSCWHLNNNESAAMWDLYLRSGEGIAIKSNVSNLINSINSNDIFCGQVQYIDYNHEIASNNTYESLFYKRRSFNHEHEFRLICFESMEAPYFKSYGTLQKCNLKQLIDEIYVSPLAPRWFTDTVRSVIIKYDINKPVIQSSLYNSPKTFF